jgi:hypothetical protein
MTLLILRSATLPQPVQGDTLAEPEASGITCACSTCWAPCAARLATMTNEHLQAVIGQPKAYTGNPDGSSSAECQLNAPQHSGRQTTAYPASATLRNSQSNTAAVNNNTAGATGPGITNNCTCIQTHCDCDSPSLLTYPAVTAVNGRVHGCSRGQYPLPWLWGHRASSLDPPPPASLGLKWHSPTTESCKEDTPPLQEPCKGSHIPLGPVPP